MRKRRSSAPLHGESSPHQALSPCSGFQLGVLGIIKKINVKDIEVRNYSEPFEVNINSIDYWVFPPLINIVVVLAGRI